MTEPLDARAAGVASLLKSLRTRAGLQADRLTGTELALGALAGLDSVRVLVAAGEATDQAIVRAAREAASSLEPTMSIVADASLRLRLSQDHVSDPMLYADELTDRRKALIKNWELLHDLRSVSPAPPVPTLRALRLEVEADALAALAVALTASAGDAALAGTGPAEFPPRPSAAPNGILPGPVQDGAVGGAASEAAVGITPRLVGGQAPTLLNVFLSVASALRGRLIRGSAGEPQGWPHDLRPPGSGALPTTATALATAYGLKAMLLLEGYLFADLSPIVLNLRTMEAEGGGYATRAQATARPEVTATVLDALHRVDATADFSQQIGSMENELGDFEKSRPYILSTMLETSLRIQPNAKLTSALINYLLKARRQYSQYSLWPEKAEPNLASPQPSTVHTARAVCALAAVQAIRPNVAGVPDAIEQGASWLDRHADLTGVSEIIARPLEATIESLPLRHFTAAWVVKALISAGLPGSHPTVSAAVAEVWKGFHSPSALWRLDNGELPIWMSFDAIEALQLAALAQIVPTRFTD